jgi:hypothetical protein
VRRQPEHEITIGGSNIDIEGTDERRGPSRWGVLGVLGLVGVAIGLVSLTQGTPAPPPVEDTVLFKNIPLTEQIPEFAGTLHVLIRINRINTYLKWPAPERAAEFELLEHARMKMNLDQSLLAAIAFVSGDGGDIRIGSPGADRAISPETTAFAWHDSQPSLIAFTRTLDNTSLWRGDINGDESYLLSSVGSIEPGAQVTAYGDWGYALLLPPDSDGNRTTQVLDPDGELIASFDGEVVGSLPGPDGGVIVADPISSAIAVSWSNSGPSVERVIDDHSIFQSLWSLDQESYAQVSDGDEPNTTLLFVQYRGGDVFTFQNYVPYAWDVSGRFLAVVRAQQIIVIDATTGDEHEIAITPGLVSDIAFSG